MGSEFLFRVGFWGKKSLHRTFTLLLALKKIALENVSLLNDPQEIILSPNSTLNYSKNLNFHLFFGGRTLDLDCIRYNSLLEFIF